MMRALEVVDATGQSILHFRKGDKKKRPFDVIKIGLSLSKPELDERINYRVEKMIDQGLVAEVTSLVRFKAVNALQTVGYAEIFEFLGGKTDLPQAINDIKLHTRQYAKRQMTWFKKDKEYHWFEPGNIKGIIDLVESEIDNR
jgi:tRNA dimethylallyltransferase